MGTTAAEQVRAAASQTTAAKPAESADLLAWFQARQKLIGISLGIIFGVGVVVWYVVVSGRQKQAQAFAALERARATVENGNFPEASSQLQKVIQTYGGTDAALEATLALNQVRMMSGQSQLAVDELRKLVASSPVGAYGAGAHSHLAMALENTGKIADATAEYLTAAQLAPESYRKVDAMLAAARGYRSQGKLKEAIALLADIVAKFPKETAAVAEAEVRLGEMSPAR